MSTNATSIANQHALIGHHRQREWFRTAIAKGRLASTFLFIGPEGIGKKTFAMYLAKSLFCERVSAAKLEPCGVCSSCVQVAAGSHPDILQVCKPEDRAIIPVELLVGRRDARMQEGLCHDIRLRPMSGDRRVAILDDCDVLNNEGANAILKTLEEPPPNALIVLIGTSLQRQLPTIRSRCQVVRFDVPIGEEANQILRQRSGEEELSQASLDLAMEIAGGDLAKATMFLNEEVREFSEHLSRMLGEEPPEAMTLAKSITTFVEAAGKEAPERRNRMRQASSLVAEHYRQRIRTAAQSNQTEVGNLEVESWLYRLQRSLDVRYQVDRNANQATLIESWAVDLQRGSELED